jgi:ATP-dependent helicase HrpA
VSVANSVESTLPDRGSALEGVFDSQLAECAARERPRLRRAIELYHQAPTAVARQRLEVKLAAVRAAWVQRRARAPRPEFPPELPISAQREAIAAAVAAHPVVIVSGETGSGKTTQLPKICLTAGRGISGQIGHTQPRRIAARATAVRIAAELGVPLGQAVGFKTRFNEAVQRDGYIKVMTDGILLAEIESDHDLLAYDTIIIDEAHERSLNIDFLLGYLKNLLARRSDLKVIITSATLDAERFAKHFGGAPVFEVSGRMYPVEVRYRPLDEAAEQDLNDGICAAVDELSRAGPGDILVFLPGEREIREASEFLRKHVAASPRLRGCDILPLYARLSSADQDRIFAPSGSRRVVLATNVAETSLTVPGVHYVIDSGLARIKRYNARTKVEQLRVEVIARASAKQRAGRCGRVAGGICIRLYAADDHDARAAYTDAELLRSSLAGVILRMLAHGLGAVDEFPFIDRPQTKFIADGYQVLTELHAIDDARQLTHTGRQLARLPLDPRLGRLLLAAHHEGCLTEALVVAAALSVQDPRERPLDAQAAADAAHAQFRDDRSDFAAWLKLWAFYQAQNEAGLSRRKATQLLRSRFLSPTRLREWYDVHTQLSGVVTELDWRLNTQAARYDALHRAILTGLIGNIGLKAEDSGQYAGGRGIKFALHPGSGLAGKGPRWVVAAELTETTRLYARTVAKVEASWIEHVARHLIKRAYGEASWDSARGQALVQERGSVFGLPLYSGRRVPLAPIDLAAARQIFLHEALVHGALGAEPEFLRHNRKLVASIRELEHRARRPDILVNDERIAAFYEQLIPPHIVDRRSFESWLKSNPEPRLLFLQRDQLMQHEAASITSEQFPPELMIDTVAYPLSYQFEPGAERDGVTLRLPLALINQINAARCEWLVPGMLPGKVSDLLKTLPAKFRHRVLPLAQTAGAFCAAVKPRGTPLLAALLDYLREHKQLPLTPDAFRPEQLAPHWHMRFEVFAAEQRFIARGRDLAALRAAHGAQGRASFGAEEIKNIVAWDFGDLPEIVEIDRAGYRLPAFPALVDAGDSVTLRVFEALDGALAAHRLGLRRLFMLQLAEQKKYALKAMPRAVELLAVTLDRRDDLREQILCAAFDIACLAEPLPRDQAAFLRRRDEAKSRVLLIAQEISRLVTGIFEQYQGLLKKFALAKFPAVQDMRAQCERLLAPGFIAATPYPRLREFPRYLNAVSLRLAKFAADPTRDERQWAQLRALEEPYLRALKTRRGSADKLEQFRWLLEELRVSLFAQELKTPQPVSCKRLQKIWESIDGGSAA